MTLPTLDDPGTKCGFDSHGCSETMLGHGGFALHHEIPQFLGGDEHGLLLTLCPNHHLRQHSLIRYLIECTGTPDRKVLAHFTAKERSAAGAALAFWQTAGRPPVTDWNVPAARGDV